MLYHTQQTDHLLAVLDLCYADIVYAQGSHQTGKLGETWKNKVARESQETFLFLQKVRKVRENIFKMIIVKLIKMAWFSCEKYYDYHFFFIKY